MSSSLQWTKIEAELPRSSHAISLVDHKLYLYGGEINPREPIDGHMHVIDTSTGEYVRVEGKGEVPEPRVGHVAAAINGNLYIFGGRGGPSMSPLEEAGAVYSFSPLTSTWTKLEPRSSDHPCARSYHAGTATASHLLVHAGCGAASTGRLRDTWMFDVSSHMWTQLADALGDTRGGAAIAVLDHKLWRFGGFNGKTELGGSIEFLELNERGSPSAASWQSKTFDDTVSSEMAGGTVDNAGRAAPGPRSIHALLPIAGRLVALLGEGKPSKTGGHDAAGHFWDDFWAYDTATGKWQEISLQGLYPSARGWFAAAHNGHQAVIWGGVNARNERLVDGWLLSVV